MYQLRKRANNEARLTANDLITSLLQNSSIAGPSGDRSTVRRHRFDVAITVSIRIDGQKSSTGWNTGTNSGAVRSWQRGSREIRNIIVVPFEVEVLKGSKANWWIPDRLTLCEGVV